MKIILRNKADTVRYAPQNQTEDAYKWTMTTNAAQLLEKEAEGHVENVCVDFSVKSVILK